MDEPPDQREGEALALQLADAGETFDVLAAVPRDAADPVRRREQAALLVEADRVDGDVGPTSQLLDPQATVHEPAF